MHDRLARRRALAMLAALAAVAAGACTRAPGHRALPPGSVVVALGDSLTFGTGAPEGASYPDLLAARTGWDVRNAGVPGDTAEQACARLPDVLDEHRPALVLALVGGNDFLRRRPEDAIRAALRTCVAHARRAGTTIAILPVPRLGLGGLADAPLYAQTAGELGVPLVEAGLADLLGTPRLRADAVHLNAEGYRAMAERIARGLAEAGWLR